MIGVTGNQPLHEPTLPKYRNSRASPAVVSHIRTHKRTYEIADVIVPTQELDEVKDFFHQIATDERASAILRRANS